MEQLILQDHPQVLAIDGNADNEWEGGREKDEKYMVSYRSSKLSCSSVRPFV